MKFFIGHFFINAMHTSRAIMQVPSEFKDVLDNTVVAGLSHSSAHVCCKIASVRFSLFVFLNSEVHENIMFFT